MLESLHWLRPAWLALIPVWLGLVWALSRKAGYQVTGWQRICSPELLAYLTGDTGDMQNRTSKRYGYVILAFTGLLVLLALSGPAWKKRSQPVFEGQQTHVMVLDLSRSMDATDLSPSRLQRAKQKITDLLQQSAEGQWALIVFAGSAFEVVPLTTDPQAILLVLESLEPDMMPVQGSLASTGLSLAEKMLDRNHVQHASIILFTDGVDEKSSDQARRLAREGHRLSVLGIGTGQGAPIPIRTQDGGRTFLKDKTGKIVTPGLDAGSLKRLADAGLGKFQIARVDDTDIRTILQGDRPELAALSDAETAKNLQADQWQESGIWLLLAVLPFFPWLFRKGVLITGLLTLFCSAIPYQPVMADSTGGWQQWFLNNDQKVAKALRDGKIPHDIGQVRDTDWQAAAHYRVGDYAEAESIWMSANTADEWYNLGNAQVMLGHYEAAEQSYQKALEIQPDMADAQFNLDLLKRMRESSQQDKSNTSETNRNPESRRSFGSKNDQQSGEQKKQASSASAQSRQQDQTDTDENGNRESSKAEGQQNSLQNAASRSTNEGDGKEDVPENSTPSGQSVRQAKNENRTTKQRQALQDYEQRLQEQMRDRQERNTGQTQIKNRQQTGENAGENDDRIGLTEKLSPQEREKKLRQKQWLRMVPDDPGGLLRRKFRYQYQQQQTQTRVMKEGVTDPW